MSLKPIKVKDVIHLLESCNPESDCYVFMYGTVDPLLPVCKPIHDIRGRGKTGGDVYFISKYFDIDFGEGEKHERD
jgi:hypothetical protein